MSVRSLSTQTWPQEYGVLIPAYNAQEDVKQFLPHLLKVVPVENVCVIDDGSNDKTGEICREFGFSVLTQSSNQGKGAALRRGFEYLSSKGTLQWIITMDADGQHAVDDLPTFIDSTKSNPNLGIVVGTRKRRLHTMPLARIFSNSLTSSFLSLITGCKIEDSQCGYRAYSVSCLRDVSTKYNRFEMESEVILKACFKGYSLAFIPIKTLYCSSQSHISHVLDILRWIRAVLSVWIAQLSYDKKSV